VYRGNPRWFAAGRITAHSDLPVEKIRREALESLGFLQLTGKERLFAIDGQHRLAGVRKVVREAPKIGHEVQSVLFVAHKDSDTGRRRIRRLFTTLNKTAKPVSKNEIIALDEDDVMAIVTRRLVEEHPSFKGSRVAFNETANLAPTDVKSLTTIVNLYDILTIVFTRIAPKAKIEELKFYRPSEAKLKMYYETACTYFAQLRNNFPPLDEYFESSNRIATVKRYRGDFGGNVMFRPIGLIVMAEVIAFLSQSRELPDSVALASRLPQTLSKPPYRNVLWEKKRGMNNQGKALVRDLMLHMLNELPKDKSESAGRRYAKALEMDEDEWRAALKRLPPVDGQ